MEFEKIIDSLNDITISEEEMAEYEEATLVDESKIAKLSTRFRGKLRGTFIGKQRKEVEEALKEGEKIEVYIDGKDVTALDRSVSLTAVPMMFLSSHNYAVFYSIYITNKRIFVGYTNYYNQVLLSKVYSYEDVEQIILDSKDFNRESGDLDRSFRLYDKVIKTIYYGVGSFLPLWGTWMLSEATLNSFGIKKNTYISLVLSTVMTYYIAKLVVRGFKKIFGVKNTVKMRFKDCNEVTLLIHNESETVKIISKLKEIEKEIKKLC